MLFKKLRNNISLDSVIIALSLGCSSGGLLLKHPGRVGPAAVIGCGCFASSGVSHPSVACCTSGTGEVLLRTQLARSYCESVISSPEPEPFTSLDKLLSKDVIHSPSFSCYPERYSALLGLFVPETGEGEVIWGHNTSHFVLSYQTTAMKRSKFVCSEANTSPGVSEGYAISSARLKFV